jgi:phosphoribosylformylglycinamidine synthase
VDHLQFASPENPEIFWTFIQAINALKDYCKYMNIPVVGGKVSFYNETKNGPIKPSPVIGSIGIIEKKSWIRESGLRDGDSIFIVGFTYDEMGGSEYYEYVRNITGGMVPEVNLHSDKLNANVMLHMIRDNVAGCVHDCSKGGLGIALAEMAVQSQIGITIDLDYVPNACARLDNLLFSESNSRFVFGTNEPAQARKMLSEFDGLHFAEIGKAEEQNKNVVFISTSKKANPPHTEAKVVDISLEKLANASNVIENLMHT